MEKKNWKDIVKSTEEKNSGQKQTRDKLLRMKNIFRTVLLEQLRSPSWYQNTTGWIKLTTNRKEKTG